MKWIKIIANGRPYISVELFREDLIDKTTPFSVIDLYSFKSKAITVKRLEEADIVIFSDNTGNINILKYKPF